jgi:hypothetical protein
MDHQDDLDIEARHMSREAQAEVARQAFRDLEGKVTRFRRDLERRVHRMPPRDDKEFHMPPVTYDTRQVRFDSRAKTRDGPTPGRPLSRHRRGPPPDMRELDGFAQMEREAWDDSRRSREHEQRERGLERQAQEMTDRMMGRRSRRQGYSDAYAYEGDEYDNYYRMERGRPSRQDNHNSRGSHRDGHDQHGGSHGYPRQEGHVNGPPEGRWEGGYGAEYAGPSPMDYFEGRARGGYGVQHFGEGCLPSYGVYL